MTRYLQSRLGDAANVGVWLPTGLGGALANLAIAFLGKTSVNLNYTAGTAPVRSAIRQAGVRVVITAKRFTARVPLELPEDVQAIYLEDVLAVGHEVAADPHLPRGRSCRPAGSSSARSGCTATRSTTR